MQTDVLGGGWFSKQMNAQKREIKDAKIEGHLTNIKPF